MNVCGHCEQSDPENSGQNPKGQTSPVLVLLIPRPLLSLNASSCPSRVYCLKSTSAENRCPERASRPVLPSSSPSSKAT